MANTERMGALLLLFSWGANSYGQLSLDDREDRHLPAVVKSSDVMPKVKQISGGGGHTAVVTCNGKCFLCGNNNKGQLGMALHQSLSLQCHPFPHLVTKVSCGWEHTLALTNAGDVYAWGSNSHGQAGLNKDSTVPVKVEGFGDRAVRDTAAGLRHSLAVTCDDAVWSWGCGKKGQLGWLKDLNNGQRLSHGPKVVSESLKCSSVEAGANHSLAVSVDNRLFGWGDNKRGQLAVEPDKHAGTLVIPSPKEIALNVVDPSKNILHLASGWTHVLILMDGGDVYSWGRNDYSQLGRPSECYQPGGEVRRDICWKPSKVQHLPKIDQIVCGSEHNLVLTESGDAYCWGWNEHGMCADGTEENVGIPKRVESLTKYKTLVIGAGAGHCMVACS